MRNKFITICMAIVTAFIFTSCNDSNKNELNTKETALLALEDSINKVEKIESEFYYGIGSRFAPISKTALDNATTIFPFNTKEENERIDKVNSTEIIIIKHNRRSDRREYGNSISLTSAQKELFKSLDYGKHFSMKTLFQEKTTRELGLEEKKYNPHYTVVPETEATYVDGETALINYLIKSTKAETNNLDHKKISANKVYFTISEKGLIKNVSMHFSTNYPELDAKLKEAVLNIPGKWNPAKNAEGENMEQELTFTFGPKGGC